MMQDRADVGTSVADGNECECSTAGADGYPDLTLKFETQQIVESLGEVNHDDIVSLILTGLLWDTTPIEGADCIVVRGKFKPFNRGDINRDGITNEVDFATMASKWLESTIVD
jgi:hypothetical protein